MLVAVFLGFIAIWLNEWLPQKRREIERARIIRAKEEPIRKTEKALFNATGWEITQLMVWLIENPPSSGIPDKRCQEVLALICAEPKLALIAFQIALSSTDERIKEVGILGLSSLKSIDGINPLLKDYITNGATS